MTGTERRNKIVGILESSDTAVPGHELSRKLKVSRQVIVQDIALLRTAGHAITSTNRGYTLGGAAQAIRLFKVKHSASQIEEEMQAVVDLGGCIVDVSVNHRTYGMINAALDIKSRRDIANFLKGLESGVSQPLSSLTDGFHFHHISAESNEILDEIEAKLSQLGFIAELSAYEKEECR